LQFSANAAIPDAGAPAAILRRKVASGYFNFPETDPVNRVGCALSLACRLHLWLGHIAATQRTDASGHLLLMVSLSLWL